MIYIFNNNSLNYKNITLPVILVFILSTICSYFIFNTKKLDLKANLEVSPIVLKELLTENTFNQEKLKNYLKSLNIKYIDIVIAQSKIETGYYTSDIFKENHNLFGMKEAKLRPTTALGTNNAHAFYTGWRESCQDYALFQASYLRNITSEKEYLEYLKQNYAQDSSYVNKIIKLIHKK